jgi:hypothetical protein
VLLGTTIEAMLRAAFALIWAALLCSAQNTNSAPAGGPSLKETLDWLREKIPLGVIKQYSNCGIAPCSTTMQNRVWNLDSCNATIGTENIYTIPEHADTHSFYRYTMSLGTINGGSVVATDDAGINPTFISGDRWEYEVRLTTSSREVLLLYSFLGATPTSQTVDYVHLKFADTSIASRVLTALRHAADLCRNKEPF